MAYSEITNAEIDTDSPVTQTLMTKMRDNPLFALSGAGFYNGAGWHPVDWTASDQTGDGLIYDNAVDGDVASVTYALEGGWDYLFVIVDLSHAGSSFSSNDLLFSDSSDGSSFSTVFTMGAFGGGANIDGMVKLILPSSTSMSVGAMCSYVAGFNGDGPKLSSADIIHSIRFNFSIENIDGGKIYAFRRREYTSGL